ncbi:MAG: hypothetical protein K2Q45_03930 [Nitrosomonas sp.]|nr:hypothetical protein [Nitrosomonas sp.]
MEEGIEDVIHYVSKRYNSVPVALISIADVIPNAKIFDYANRQEWSFDYKSLKLKQNQPGSISLLPCNICWLLANAFLGNIKGKLHFKLLFESSNSMAKERLLCIFDYFNRFEERLEPNVPVIITRHRVSNLQNWHDKKELVIDSSMVVIHMDKMEEVGNCAFVDFANRNLHIGQIIPSLTQEEILFSTCSECFVAILFVEELLDEECVIFENVWRHSSYTGYAQWFKWKGPENLITEILAIDATMHDQYSLVERDMNKAYLAFSEAKSNIISTGKWGCGVFGGDTTLKFLQQIIANQLAHRKTMFYSAFKSDIEMDQYTHLLSLIRAKKPTVGWFIETAKKFNEREFNVYLCNKLNKL